MAAPYTASRRIGYLHEPALPQGDAANLDLARTLLDARMFALGVGAAVYEGVTRTVIGGNAAAPSLTPGDIESVVAQDANQIAWAMSAISPGAVLPGVLAASTVHYLYAGASTGGALTCTVSASPPSYGNHLVVGSELRRLIATFATGLLGFPLPAVVGPRAGKYILSSGRAELIALDNGRTSNPATPAWTAVSLATLVPPWATTAWVYCRIYKAAANTGVRELRVRRSSADGGYLVAASVLSADAAGAPADTNVEQLVQVPLLNQSFEYNLSAAVTNSDPYGARFLVAGWE